MRWRYCLCVVGPLALGPRFFLVKSNFEGALGFGTRGDCAARLRCQRPRSPPIRVQVLGNTTACDHGGTPCSQNLPKYRSLVLGQCGTSLMPGATPGRPQCISHASRGAGNVAHKASPWRIDKACAKLLNIQSTAWVQQRLPQDHVKGWAWQDQWILRLSSKSECNISLVC